MSAALTPTPRRFSRLRRLAVEMAALVLGIVFVAGLLFLVGPSLLSWGERRAYDADERLLQQAVDAYRRSAPALRPWPTISGRIGEPAVGAVGGFQCDEGDRQEVCPWIDVEALATARHLSGPDAINSADLTLNASATNAPTGSYGWYLNAEGKVRSQPPFSPGTGYP